MRQSRRSQNAANHGDTKGRGVDYVMALGAQKRMEIQEQINAQLDSIENQGWGETEGLEASSAHEEVASKGHRGQTKEERNKVRHNLGFRV